MYKHKISSRKSFPWDILLLFLVPLLFGLALPLICALLLGMQDDTPTHDPSRRTALSLPDTVSVYDTASGTVFYQPIESYIKNVVAAEMPASFQTEALKAQAVAARTYTLYKMQSADKSAHNGADVCTDFSHCKAYADENAQREKFGANYEAYSARIGDAVEATASEILCYDNQPILAVFHAMSSGRTESSADVWGGARPYLVSVESAGDRDAQGYETTVCLPPEELLSTLRNSGFAPDESLSPESAVGEPTHTDGGSVRDITLYGVALSGTEIRSLFGLRSANFDLVYDGAQFVFTVRGYGHGVGMSQQGANSMASSGSDYTSILAWYYPGTTLIHAAKK